MKNAVGGVLEPILQDFTTDVKLQVENLIKPEIQ